MEELFIKLKFYYQISIRCQYNKETVFVACYPTIQRLLVVIGVIFVQLTILSQVPQVSPTLDSNETLSKYGIFHWDYILNFLKIIRNYAVKMIHTYLTHSNLNEISR